MKPIIILPPDTMSSEDLKMLRENDICVVVASDPSKVKFVDPIPSCSSRTRIEEAAIQLSRTILSKNTYDSETRGSFAKMYIDLLLKGTPLDSQPSQQELEKQAYDQTKIDEWRRIAREDAKAERAAAKVKATPSK